MSTITLAPPPPSGPSPSPVAGGLPVPVRPKFNSHITSDRLREGGGADKKLGAASAREQLARRGMNKRAMMDAAKASLGDEVMDLDGPFPGEDGKKRAGKRKM
ncbi:hypothetical protein NLG97_g9886 [Lecanicillium saksenae]|uniref:Uncharacterized protein n=1 Tax=Lecanicillium saksenae TaxID=468837 RepID=A0ACC1QI00_9HYPO|nr:hypothetical protein NLG97_g9886 [Lecanicillium saksenae]